MCGLSRDPDKQRAWRQRGARNYEDKLREEGKKFSNMKRSRIKPRNDERAEKDRLRAYGPPERRRMVRRMPCRVPGCHRQSENAHLPGAGGMGYKGDYDTIVNLCGRHHRTGDKSLHNLGSVKRFEEAWGIWLPDVAVEVEERWRERRSRLMEGSDDE